MRHALWSGVAVAVIVLTGQAWAELCNVKVVTDASPDYYDLPSLVRSVAARWATPEEKCWAMFYWNHIARRQTAPMRLHGLELTDPIRQFNDYGFAMCSTIAGINCSIWDAMGYKVRYWDISLHTVSEVFYGGRWHIYDNSMSALYTLCDGTTIAGVEDVGKEGACAASGGRREPGHIARYHCLNGTSPNGFLTGADCPRSLASEYGCFNPKGLKHRYYFHDWDRGHRYILNLREREAYTRHYRSLGTSNAFYVPNRGKDPESVNKRYRIRGNGTRTFKPTLQAAALPREIHSMAGVRALEPAGVGPAKPDAPGQVIFKIEGANVITALLIQATFERKGADDVNAVAVSTTNGLTWTDVWKNEKTGRTPIEIDLVEPVNGAYEVLVRVTLKGDAALHAIDFQTTTMLNSKTQPQLLLGKNTVFVGLGDPTESIVLWPDLQGTAYKPYAVEEKNIATAPKHPGYMGTLFAAKPNEEAHVVFRIDAPRNITRVTYGGRLYNRAPKAHIDLLHSFDAGRTWKQTYSLTNTKPPWDVIHYETVDDVPPGTRSVLFKYRFNASAAGSNACSIYAVRMEANHQPADPTFRPLEVTFAWDERQKDYTVVPRTHTQLVERVPFRYTVNVGGHDHPVVRSLRVNLKGAVPDVRYGYSDGKDAGGEKFVHRWVTYGTNLAEGKPYTASVPSGTNWGAGDPDGKKLTDGVVGPPYAGGTVPSFGVLWQKGTKPEVTVDLGKPAACAAFRIQLAAGWPWWDALKGQVKDTVEVLTSLNGKSFASQGFFDLDLHWKDIPINHLMPDDETAQGYTFIHIPPAPVQARYVRFAITPQRMLTVSEVQVLDAISYRPFDFRITLPDDKVETPAKPAAAVPAPAASAKKDALPRLAVPRVSAAPKIDGLLDDTTWRKANGVVGFRQTQGQPSTATTRLYVGQDAEALYIAVECFDTAEAIRNLKANAATHDQTNVYEDDDVELFIGPTGQRDPYYQIIINPRGVTWDAHHKSAGNPDASWNPKCRIAVHIGASSWTVETAFPWSVFDRSTSCTSEWTFNALRMRQGVQEASYWSPVLRQSAHTPARFGTLTGIRGTIPVRR